MEQDVLEKAVRLAAKTGAVQVATVDALGQPYVTIAPEMTLFPSGHLGLRKWFCPVTINNVKINKKVALLVWDRESDRGYQILGTTRSVEDMALMDGYSPEKDAACHYPQVERLLIVEVNDVHNYRQSMACDGERQSVCP